jgi:hypothetical protein
MKLSQRRANILASGIFTVITLFVLWVPFLIIFGFDLISASIQGGLCGPIGQSISQASAELNQSWVDMENAAIQNDPEHAKEISTFFTQIQNAIQSIADKAESQMFNSDTSFNPIDAQSNSNLVNWMWTAMGAVIILGSIGIYVIVTKYQLDWGIFLTRNFITLLFVFIVEMSIFGGIAMRYIPWNINDVLNGVFAELS